MMNLPCGSQEGKIKAKKENCQGGKFQLSIQVFKNDRGCFVNS